MYRRKLAEVDAFIDRLGAVRAELHEKLAEALTRQHAPCNRADPGAVVDQTPFDPCRV
jgi:hypothetical protein